MARAKRKLPAKPAAFISPQHRSHFCRRHPIPEHKAPPPTIHTPQKPTARSNSTDRRPNTKNPLPLRTPPAVFISSHHRGHFCRRHPIPEHKAPAADDNTHPTKTSRPGQTAPTDARTQKNPLPLRTPPAAFFSPQHRRHFCRRQPAPERKKPAAAPNTAGRFHFSATPQSLLPPSSDTRTQSPRRRRQYTPHKNLTPRSNGTDRRPNTKNPLPPTIHTPQKPHGPVKRHRPIPEHKKNPLPLRTPPAGFVFSHHRSPSCCRHPIPEHKAPAADNTHPTKTSRLGQTAPTDARTQKTRCRSEHRRPFPLSLKKPQRCLNAIVQRQPPPAGAQHHLTQPNPNISGRRFTAFFALRCL